MNFKHASKLVWTILLDISAIGAILLAIQPFAIWYLERSPAIGVDLYNSITYVSYQLRHFSLPFNSFKDLTFGGFPLFFDTPQLAFYLMLPLAAMYGPGLGVQLFAIFSLCLLILSCYYLFFRLTDNFGISIFLAILVLLSVNIYADLTWAGSLPYFLSQAFFPLGLFFAVRYFWEANVKNLSLLAAIAGLGFLIHPLSILAFLLPSIFLFIIAGGIYGGFSIGRTIKHFAFFTIIFLLCSFVVSGRYILNPILIINALKPTSVVTIAAPSSEQTDTLSQVASHYRAQIPRLYKNTNPLIFEVTAVGAVFFLLAFVFGKQKKPSLLCVVFGLITVYCALHTILNLSGKIGILIHDPYRAFWQFTVAAAAFAASLWGYFLATFGKKLWTSIHLKIIHVTIGFVITLSFSILTYFVFKTQTDDLILKIESTSTQIELSSAYPEALSINLSDAEGLKRLRAQLLPSFIDPEDKNRRLYEADAAVNIWWSSFFDVPLARGYADPPLSPEERGGLFWLDIAMTGETIVKALNIDRETAFLNTLFLIDWNGIGYFEGGREGIKGPSVPPSSYLLEEKVFDRQEEVSVYGRVSKWNTLSGRPELQLDVPEKLNFYKVDDRYTSPIVTATNASPVIVLGTRAGYEDILRILASGNINSRKLIPVWGGEFIDEFNLRQLGDFDAVILNQYKYHNKGRAYGTLEKYVAAGGKVFIDSGGEVKDSDNSDLPEIFPFKSSQRKSIGRDWQISEEADEILEGVNSAEFGPLVFGEDEWKLTTPTGDLRPGSKVLLKHRDKPVLVKMNFGQGKVIWSGMNLPYHYSQYKKNDEARIFINALAQFTNISDHTPLAVETKWIRPEKVAVKTGEKPRGILFKEQGWGGWQAHLRNNSSKGAKLPLYLTGPTFPGFMYVPTRNVSKTESLNLEFRYGGERLAWIVTFVNVVAVLLIGEYVIFDGRIHGRRTYAVLQKSLGKFFKWWDREEG